MRHLVHYWSTFVSPYRKIYHTYSMMGLLLVSVIALLACGTAATPAPTSSPGPTPTTPPTPVRQVVEEPAPVESLVIEIINVDPVTAELVLVTGLPNGCYSFKGHQLEREGDAYRVTATNVRPDDATLMCTMVYGMETTRIPLTGDIRVCDVYTVVVNGQSSSVRAMIPGQECAGAPLLEEPAPIESVTIEVTTGDPTQANLVVISGLPNACYSFGSYDISRGGDTFQVQVINLLPDDPLLACAEIYGMVKTEIPLEGEIEVCRTYTVNLNGRGYSVQAIAPNVRCSDTGGSAGTELTVSVGETVVVGNEGLTVTFLAVTEDSRCPSDALCIQSGQATIAVKGEKDGRVLGDVSLTLGGSVVSVPQTLGGYTLELTRLAPHPITTLVIQPENYVAYIKVTRG